MEENENITAIPECDVEIIEGTLDWERTISQPVQVVEMEVPVQQIIVNGQTQVVTGKACALVCPKCGTILQRFNPGVSVTEVVLSLNAKNDSMLEKNTVYCKSCGQKLSILRPSPVDNQIEQ